ncbi:hypothetical protein [Streptomyces yaizuensis]|uniref:Oxidoreductase n=1 Tax=Streptomyces yaizuensis TaxID=2989713 RepID=A0ABQ5NUJ9_9ACTN|nr:hypothetical protein [Streptomyces sp. YSPA8]GLF94039.1 oxidoreductase [Streptomyces sp. YSPA8]
MSAVLLLLLGLADAAFAGFRASAGRDGRIRRAAAHARAARRGVALGAPGLLLTALVAGTLLLTAGSPADRYAELDAAARRMLLVLAPYTLAVAVSLVAYLWAPHRVGTLAVVIGLGPLTLLRPLVVAAGAVAAAWGSPAAGAVAVTAAAGVLLVEPLVHRRWYATPL